VTGTTVETGDGVRLAVEIDGPDSAPVTVVLAHGWTLDARIWRPVATALLAGPRPPRVIRYDHRGHGRSDRVPPQSMTIDRLADDLAEVLAATTATGRLVLAGHSMGGMTLMALAQRHPALLDRVRGVALVATASGGVADISFGLPARGAAVVRAIDRRMHGSARWARRASMGHPLLLEPGLRWLLLGARPDATARRLTRECVAACPPATVAGFRATLDAHERDAALSAFAQIPTQVLVGSRDRLTPVAAARRIVAGLPSAALTVFPGAGHMLPVERVPGVAARIAALLYGTTRDPR
jgi:pimeloyl-ACP methyl ester carboxylesterase